MSKKEKHVEEQVICDECGRTITTSHWYKIFSNEHRDFCSESCGVKFRDGYYRIRSYEKYPQVIGNTD